MPLPDEFFQGPSLLNNDKKKVRSTISSNLPMPGEAEAKEAETGSVWDLFEEGAKGYASGLTWGATEFLEDQDDELSRWGQAGRILGETGALFTPYVGPFAMLGKAGNLLTKFGKHATPNIIKRGVSAAGSQAVKGAQKGEALLEQNWLLKQADKISKASQNTKNPLSIKDVQSQIASNIEKGLMKSSFDNKNYQWMKNLAGNIDQRQEALKRIEKSTQYAIKAAFAKSGIKNVSTTNVNNLTGRFMDEITKGKHINEITSMWAKWLGAGKEAGLARDFLANYGGEAMQDILIMGMHGSVNNYLKTVARGEQYTWDHAYHDAKLNATMGLMFPAIKLVPFGGKESLGQGFTNFMKSYKKLDYKKMMEENGEESMVGLVKMIQKGGLFDLKGLSVFRNKGYTVNGKVYKSADDIQRAIGRKEFNADDVVELLDLYRADTVKHLTTDWAKRYFSDFAKSSLRMGLGTMAMNVDLFREGLMDGMNPEEIGIHMMTAALMTKSRGRWGHIERYSDKSQQQHLADITPYHEAMDLLGLDPKGYTDLIKMYQVSDVQEKMGAVYGQNSAGQEVFTAFESAGEASGGKAVGKFSPVQYPHVAQMHDIYRMIHRQKGADATATRKGSFDPKYFDATTLNALETRLKKIKFDDGQAFEDLSFESIKGKLTRDAANETWNVFRGILKEFDTVGINIREDGDILKVDDFEWKGDGDAFGQAREILKKFEDIGLVEFTQDTKQINAADAEMLERAQEIIHRGKITLNRHHGIEDWNFDFSGGKAFGGANPYYDFVSDAKRIEALEGLSLMVDRRAPKETDPQAFKQLEMLGINADLLFMHKQSVNGIDRKRYLRNISDYEIVFTDREIEAFTKNKSRSSEQIIQEMKDDVRAQLEGLHDIMGFTNGSKHSRKTKGTIEYSQARKLADQFVELKLKLPEDVKNRFGTEGIEYIKNRYLSERKFDQRGIAAVMELTSRWDLRTNADRKIELPGIEWFKESIREQHGRNISEAKVEEASRKYEEVIKAIGHEHVDFVDTVWGDASQSRTMQNIDPTEIHKIHAALKDKKFNEFIYQGSHIVSNALGKGTANELEIRALHERLESIRQDIDVPGKNTLEEMESLKADIENLKLKDSIALSKPTGEKKNSADDSPILSNKESARLEERMQEWDTMLQSIDLFTEAFNKVSLSSRHKNSAEALQALKAFKDSEAIGLTGSISNVIANILTAKQAGVNRLQKIIGEVATNTPVGKDGYSRAESMHYFNKIEKEIANELGELYNKDLSFRDLIKLYNENGGADRLIAIAEQYETMRNVNRSKYSKYTQEFSDILESLDAKSPVSHNSDAPIVIAKRYGLESKKDPNDFDEVFVEKVAQDDLIDAFDYGLKRIDEMAALDKSMTKADINERKKEWAKDANGLMLRITNAVETVQMRLVEGGLIHETVSGRSNPNQDFKNRPWAPGEAGYDMIKLDRNFIVRSKDGKTLRKIDLDNLVGGDVTPATVHAYIQDIISKQKLVDGDLRQYVLERMGDDKNVLQKDFKTFQDAAYFSDDYLIYMRLTPGMHDLFVASEPNIKKLNADYDMWYTDKLNWLKRNKPELEQTFVNSFGDVSKMVGSTGKPTNKMLELKMLLMHTDYTMASEFNKVLTKIKDGDIQDLPKVYANMFKRGFLSDGGTSNRMSDKLLKLISDKTTDNTVKSMTSALIADPNIQTLIVKDEQFHNSSQPNIADPFHVKHAVESQIKERIQARMVALKAKKLPQQEYEIQERHLKRVADNQIKSLESSNINGAIPVSYRLMKTLLAAEGKTLADGNGIKPVIAQTGFGADGMLGKGFLYYDPGVKFPAGVDIIMPESAAKAYGGRTANNVHDITGLDLFGSSTNVDGNWNKRMRDVIKTQSFDRHIMNLDYKNIGLGFTGHDPGKVSISNSTSSLENTAYVAEMRLWQKMEDIIDNLHVNHIEKLNTKNRLADFLFQVKEEQGFEYSQGATGLARALVNSSINIQNPLIRNTIFRLIRSQDFKNLQKPFTTNGADGFIVPDSDGSLRHSTQLEFINDTMHREKLDLKSKKQFTNDWVDETSHRFTVGYGEISVPRATLARIYYNNLDNYTFAYGDNGVDVLIKGIGGANNFKTELHSIHDLAGVENLRLKNIEAGDKRVNPKLEKRDTKKEARVKKLMGGLNTAVRENALDLAEINQLISNSTDFTVSKSNRDVKLTDYVSLTKDEIRALDFSLTGSGVAIPLKGGDKAIHRISNQMMNNNMKGVVKINSYDAAVVHQRDFDGDHFYYYFDKSFRALKHDQIHSMRMLDYKQFEKPSPNINPFGFSKDFKAGADEVNVGHQKFSAMVSQAKRAIGTNIGDRDAISQLIRLGFNHKNQGQLLDIIGERTPEYADVGPAKRGRTSAGITASESILNVNSREFKTFERMMYINQSGFDVYPSVPDILSQRNLRRLSLKGDKESEVLDDPLFEGLSDANIFNGKNISNHWSDTRVGDQIINILMRTLKRNNMISNDVYDEAGGRPPEPKEMRDQIRDMRSFIDNPNRYLVDKLQNRIKRMRNKEEREALLEEMTNLFYGGTFKKANYKDNIKQWADDVYNGKQLPAPDDVFSFNNAINKSSGDNRLLQAIKAHTGLANLYEVNKRNFYVDDTFADVNNEFFPGLMGSVGYAVDGLLGRIKFIQAYGSDVYATTGKGKDRQFRFKIGDPLLDFTDTNGKLHTVRKSIQKGIMLSALNKEYSDLDKQLKWFSEERYTNPNKIRSLRDKIDLTKTAINLLERQYYEGLVAKKNNLVRPARTYKPGQSWVKHEPVKRTYVYAIKKNYLDKDGVLDYKKFDPYQSGWYGPKEYGRKNYVQKPDYVYIETKTPAVLESINKVDASYGDALHKITLYDGDADAVFRNDYIPTMEFYDSVIQLRAQLSSNLRDHNRLRKKVGRILQSEGFEWSSAREQQLIREFMEGKKGSKGKYRAGWVDILQDKYNLSEYDARRFLLHNLSKPESLAGHYREVALDGTRIDLPYYKVNDRLVKAVTKYYVDNGDNFGRKANGKDIVDEFINNWENTQEGVNVNVRKFVEHRGAMYHKKYDLNKLAKEDSYIESMLGPAMGRNPYVQYKLKEAGAEYLKTSTIESGSGTQNIIVKKPNNGQRRGSNDC